MKFTNVVKDAAARGNRIRGVRGIVAPHIESVEAARQVVVTTKYGRQPGFAVCPDAPGPGRFHRPRAGGVSAPRGSWRMPRGKRRRMRTGADR